jgi:hypothetical protein
MVNRVVTIVSHAAKITSDKAYVFLITVVLVTAILALTSGIFPEMEGKLIVLATLILAIVLIRSG